VHGPCLPAQVVQGPWKGDRVALLDGTVQFERLQDERRSLASDGRAYGKKPLAKLPLPCLQGRALDVVDRPVGSAIDIQYPQEVVNRQQEPLQRLVEE
jgi:hypothetical protein